MKANTTEAVNAFISGRSFKKANTYAPIFTGFYESIFDFNPDSYIEENDCSYDDLEIDFKSYELDVSREICKAIERHMSDWVVSCEFESLQSPKYYNFENDSINCEIEARNIDTYIYSNIDAFKKYLKENYTSCDGFISSHSSNFYDWELNTNKFIDFSFNGHYLGSILNFIAENEGITEYDLYNDVFDKICEFDYITLK